MASASHDQATGLYSDVLLTPSEFVVKQRSTQTPACAVAAYYAFSSIHTVCPSVRLSVSVCPVKVMVKKDHSPKELRRGAHLPFINR